MQCPVDSTTLAMADRMGIEIDYCPTCRGVWLDRGELDKLIERSNTQTANGSSKEHGKDDSNQNDNHEQRKKKKGSFLGDVLGGFGGE